MKRKFRITVDGQPYEVTVEEVTEGGRLIPQPGDMQVPASPAPAAPPPAVAPGPAASGPGAETSPLAGVVESVEVRVGQAVAAGDRIAVLEAMKMKTVVAARHAGKVVRIAVEPGQSVDAGQLLMVIE